ncbi:patatin-like phospholipase family protein [Hymenobacter metallicola]|nr:patatin-like phospholipase family protein [Hymenobacter metallicola]
MPAPQPELLQPEQFTRHPQVLEALEKLHDYIALKTLETGGWRVSDIGGGPAYTPDPQRPERSYALQYVDLVMEGGGMLGIALVGYVYALEQVGIRFLRLGGTSAGSINALLMAVAAPRQEPSTTWIIEQLANQNFYDFVDGDDDARDFTADLLKPTQTGRGIWGWLNRTASKAGLISDGLQIVDNIRDDFGLHRGEVFKAWLARLLNQRGVNTIERLVTLRAQVPATGLHRTHTADNAPAQTPYTPEDLCRVAIVAADITTQTKVVFPEMAPLYWGDWRHVHPAELVRASMSIPLFFQPYQIRHMPGYNLPPVQAKSYTDAWAALGYTGPIPESVMFMDGGIMSNFPIDLFHDNTQVPAAPTFGIKLGIDRGMARATRNLPGVLAAMFDAARTQYDFDFIHRNSDYRHLVHCLNVDGFNWLDFNMPNRDKVNLFLVGVRGAVEFLTKFDWEAYKKLRKAKVDVVQQSRAMDDSKTRLPEPRPTDLTWPCVMPTYMKPAIAAQQLPAVGHAV